MITGLERSKGRFRSSKLILRGEIHKEEEIQAKNNGRRCRTKQEVGSVEERTRWRSAGRR